MHGRKSWQMILIGFLHELRVIYSGTIIGELIRDKLVPHHALAMSGLVNETIGRLKVNKENAIQYLKRKDICIRSMKIKAGNW